MLTWLEHLKTALWPKRKQPQRGHINQDRTSPEATPGEKMTGITTRFWTNNIAEDRSIEVAERAFLARIRRMQQNDPPKIVPKSPSPFKPVFDADAVMRQALIDRSITLPSSRETDRYLDQKLKQPARRKNTSDYDA